MRDSWLNSHMENILYTLDIPSSSLSCHALFPRLYPRCNIQLLFWFFGFLFFFFLSPSLALIATDFSKVLSSHCPKASTEASRALQLWRQSRGLAGPLHKTKLSGACSSLKRQHLCPVKQLSSCSHERKQDLQLWGPRMAARLFGARSKHCQHWQNGFAYHLQKAASKKAKPGKITVANFKT